MSAAAEGGRWQRLPWGPHRARDAGPLLAVAFALRCAGAGTRRRVGPAAFAWALTTLVAAPAFAQLGTLASPGQLSRAHAELEGLTNCRKCHEAGHEVTASKCLPCHKAVADRIARRTGVHRAVTDTCVTCHVEHGGAEADLRRFDTRSFDHRAVTGFPLEGQHARLAATCAACHKKRSFLDARPACASCHADVHKGTLGTDCTRCHSTAVTFKQARGEFDHRNAQFMLTGAHRAVACEKCHAGGVFRGLRFDTCAACHKEPHRSTLGPSCTACHVTDHWTTRVIDHSKTRFPLAGLHVQVACERCHATGITRPLAFERCASCHVNVHRESVKDDCRACHYENGFRGARFDHAARTSFPLVGRHEGLACRKCHTSVSAESVPLASKVADFGGLRSECLACHKDQHKGEYGRACEACHRPATFKTAGFTHPRAPEFYSGRHSGVACARCHVRPDLQPASAAPPGAPVRATAPAMACGTCHADAHLGQLGAACERCHAVDAARLAVAPRFSHQATGFRLTGRHVSLDCAKCHPSEAGAFPAGQGTARRVKPMSGDCRACHKDPHLGQVDAGCATCHLTASFELASYEHRGLDALFGVASHARLPCRSCHKRETAQFPGGRGTAVRLKGLGRTCLECHP